MLQTAKRMVKRTIRRIVDQYIGNGLMQDDSEALDSLESSARIKALCRQAAAEACVLLKNEANALPLCAGERVAVFGRCARDWFYMGYGSGGSVHAPYTVNLIDAILRAGELSLDDALDDRYAAFSRSPKTAVEAGWWGRWDTHYAEMPVSEDVVSATAAGNDAAIVVIGRAAGEDLDMPLKKGGFYLTDDEIALLDSVTARFSRVIVVINSGSVVDFAQLCAYKERIKAILLCPHGGMESGNAVYDVLLGKVNPCGRLADTIAARYEDYPSAPHFGQRVHSDLTEDIYVGYRYFETFAPEQTLFPFGFGLSYTTFSIAPVSFSQDVDRFTVCVSVKNTGARAGKTVAQLYVSAPDGVLGKAKRSLTAFAKTNLLSPGETVELSLSCTAYDLSSYDEAGDAGFPSAYVLEAGDYAFYAGEDVRCETRAGVYTVSETRLIKQCEEALSPQAPFDRLTKNGFRPVKTRGFDLKARILSRLPQERAVTGERGISLNDVRDGRASLNDFIAQLSDVELEALTRGEGEMMSALGPVGNAGVFGGVLPSLRAKGVPAVVTSDGPSGVRRGGCASLIPCASALACTFDAPLVERLYRALGEEAAAQGIDMLLAPSLNLHGNPLCGRNFEYYSEDPVLSGRLAAAAVRGLQGAVGLSACPKHIACNQQELARNRVDSRVSERALREVYLKGFEICVAESAPLCVMSSYNKVNGVWSHYAYDLFTTILRREWGYDGMVVTDWWMQKDVSPEFPLLYDNAYRVRAQVDVLMPGSMKHGEKIYRADASLLSSLGKQGGVTRGELQRTAENVLRFCMRSIAMERARSSATAHAIEPNGRA